MSRTRLAVLAWLAFVAACVIVIGRTQFTTDLSAFLPRSPSPAQQLLVDQLKDGVVSRLVLIGIEGAAPESLAKISRAMAATLRKQPAFVAVSNGESSGLEQDRDFLWRNRYLLSPAVTSERFSQAGLRAALEEDLALLASPAGSLVRRILADDPTGELLALIDQLAGQAKPASRDGVWFSGDGRRALLVAQTSAAGYDLDAQEHAIGKLRAAFESAREASHAEGVRVILTGPGVFSVGSRATIRSDALRLSLIATTLIAAMLLAVYRSWRVLVLGLIPVASGALAGVAAVSLGFGSVHGITLAFGVTLIGEGIDYAIYLFTQVAPDNPPETTLLRIWPTLRLGVLTSICGFSAMLFSGFPGLAQLGLFSIVGLIVAVTVTRFVLPGLLPAGFAARTVGRFAPAVMVAARKAPGARLVLAFVVLAAAAYIAMHPKPLWSTELTSLNPVPVSEQRLDVELRRAIGAPDVRHLVVVRASDPDAALFASETVGAALQGLMRNGALQGFDSPASYLPSRQTQQARQAAIPEPAVLRENFQQALAGLPFRSDLFAPFFAGIAAAKTQPLVERANLDGTNLALKVDSLLVRQRDGWAAMLPLRGVTDSAAIAREIDRFPGERATMVDLKDESDRLFRDYLREATLLSLVGAAAIVVLLFASLRSMRRVATVLAPLAAAVIVTAAALVLAGEQLSIFHLVGLLLVVAVGSNYALFFERGETSTDARERTLVSLLFANVSTAIGFGLLALSKVPVLNALGATVGIGAILSLIFAAVLVRARGDRP